MKIMKCSEEDFDKKVADFVINVISDWQRDNAGLFKLGLTGGSTPRGLYGLIAASSKIDWQRVLCLITDERYVPSTDENSNYRMINEYLLGPAKVPEENIIAFNTDDLSWLNSVDEINGQLQDLLSFDDNLFDLLLLGVGPDGHVASVFPGNEALDSEKLALTSETDEFAVQQRLTFSLKSLKMTKECFLLLKGKKKYPIFDLIQESGSLPVQQLVTQVDNCSLFFGLS